MLHHRDAPSAERQCRRIVAPMGNGGPGMANGGSAIFLFESGTNEQDFVAPRQPTVSTCIAGIQHQCLFEQRQSLGRLFWHCEVDMRDGTQNEIISIETITPLASGTLYLPLAQPRFN